MSSGGPSGLGGPRSQDSQAAKRRAIEAQQAQQQKATEEARQRAAEEAQAGQGSAAVQQPSTTPLSVGAQDAPTRYKDAKPPAPKGSQTILPGSPKLQPPEQMPTTPPPTEGSMAWLRSFEASVKAKSAQATPPEAAAAQLDESQLDPQASFTPATPGPWRDSYAMPSSVQATTATAPSASATSIQRPVYTVNLQAVDQTCRHIERLLQGKGLDERMPAPADVGKALSEELRVLNPGELSAVMQRLKPDQIEGVFRSMSPEQRNGFIDQLKQTDRGSIAEAYKALNRMGLGKDDKALELRNLFKPNPHASNQKLAPERLDVDVVGAGSQAPAAGGTQQAKPPQDPTILLGRAVQHTIATEGQAGVAEAKKQVQTAVNEVLKEYYAAQTPQNKDAAIKKLNELEMKLQNSQADKKSKDALAAIIGSGVGMIEAYEKGDAVGFAANAATLGKGAWDFGEKLLVGKFGAEKYLALTEKVHSGADAASAVASAFKAYQYFRDGKVKEGTAEALKSTGSIWSLARKVFKDTGKIPKGLGEKIGRVLAGGPQVATAIFDLKEAIEQHDAAKGVAATGGLGQGIMTMLGPDKLKALGLSASQQTMMSVAFSVAQDAPELHKAAKYLAVKGINFGDPACNAAIASIATIAGKQGVYAYTLSKTGNQLLASSLSALTAFALNKGYQYMKEMADNQDLVNYVDGRLGNAKAATQWGTKKLGLSKEEAARFADYLLAGDQNTKVAMRGILAMSKDMSNPQAVEHAREAFRTLDRERTLNLNTGNYGYSPEPGQIGNSDYTKV